MNSKQRRRQLRSNPPKAQIAKTVTGVSIKPYPGAINPSHQLIIHRALARDNETDQAEFYFPEYKIDPPRLTPVTPEEKAMYEEMREKFKELRVNMMKARNAALMGSRFDFSLPALVRLFDVVDPKQVGPNNDSKTDPNA